MSTASKIEWTETTWNPTTGCDRISPGCDNCYALALARRLKAMGSAKYQQDGDPRTSGPGFGVMFHETALMEPLHWRKPRRVFVNSMSDLGHARVSDTAVARMFAVMCVASHHTYQVLTKRPRRLAKLLSSSEFVGMVAQSIRDIVTVAPAGKSSVQWPLPNVWIGTSVESDEYCWRVDALRRVPAGIRFLSLEPLLGPLPGLDLTDIDWVIVGGESGPGHRLLNLDWVRDVRDQCVRRRIPVFFKQVGGRTPKSGGRLLDGRTWDEYPVALD